MNSIQLGYSSSLISKRLELAVQIKFHLPAEGSVVEVRSVHSLFVAARRGATAAAAAVGPGGGRGAVDWGRDTSGHYTKPQKTIQSPTDCTKTHNIVQILTKNKNTNTSVLPKRHV